MSSNFMKTAMPFLFIIGATFFLLLILLNVRTPPTLSFYLKQILIPFRLGY